MTNSEKYLKDGVDSRYFATALYKFILQGSNTSEENSILGYINTFLDLPVQPTLTEDEKVILRNLHYEKGAYEYERIGRTRKDSEGYSDLYLIEKDLTVTNFNEYIHLFQFIKERRRILY